MNPGLLKRSRFRLVSVAAGLVAGLIFSAVAFTVGVEYCRATRRGVPCRSSGLVQRIFRDPGFAELLAVIGKNSPDTFKTVWDYDAAAHLSKELFIPTKMYGAIRYRYKPNVPALNVALWTGLNVQAFCLVDDPLVRRCLRRCDVIAHAQFRIDRHGFKATEFTANPGQPTVLFLGDSFTEGLYTSPAKTFVNLFGRRMRERGFEGSPVNTGVNGYSAMEMCWVLERSLPTWQPHVVIANLFPNDVHANYREVIRGEGDHQSGYREMVSYLERMQELCRLSGARFVVSVIPAKEQLLMSPRLEVFQSRVRDWCAGFDVRLADPLEHFRAIGPRRIYLSWDPHFSPEGHRLYADYLFERCLEVLKEVHVSA